MNADADDIAADDDTPSPESARREIPRGGPTEAEKVELRSKLLSQRSELGRSSKDLADEALKGSGQDFKVDHMADFGSDNFEQEISLSLLEEETELLHEIDTAIRKIDGQEELPYGLCEECHASGWEDEERGPWIPTGRLDFVPYVRLCVQHQEQQEGDAAQ